MNFSTLFAAFRSKSALKGIQSTVKRISALESSLQDCSNDTLKERFEALKQRPEKERTIEGFAIVREMSRRVLQLRHFDVQLMGGLCLLKGLLAEMRTGEGKTLTISAPASLKALEGKGVHVVTANSYLAHRDSELMRPLYEALGLSVGFIHAGMNLLEKQQAYQCDITYGVGSDFGFDYLRDNLVKDQSHRMQRGTHCAIVDEIDSILIDEARTPLIISGEGTQLDEIIEAIDKIAKTLRVKEHFEINLKENSLAITDEGYAKVETGLVAVGLIAPESNLYSAQNLPLVRMVHSAVRAYGMFKRDKDYVVHAQEVILIDQGTGRKMPGRRLDDGLHEAIEAKEGLAIHPGTETRATITFQNYFRLYQDLSGLSGTAMTEADEFVEFYNLEPVVVPTNKPIARFESEDRIFATKAQKFNASVAEIAKRKEKGQPVLIGCASVRDAEVMSQLLKKAKIDHEVLTAKHIEREAHIIANAGRKYAVTVATNMAGRGTDIALGGEVPDEPTLDIPLDSTPEQAEALTAQFTAQLEAHQRLVAERRAEQQEVIALGGLYVLGTERNGIRRVDNQLAGRAGRQGDPGEVQFFLSLEDEILRVFAESKKFKALYSVLGDNSDDGMSGQALAKLIVTAQTRVEGQGFEARRQLMQFDSVLASQRQAVYDLRNQLLESGCEEFCDNALGLSLLSWSARYMDDNLLPEQWDAAALKAQFEADFGIQAGFIKWIHVEELESKKILALLHESLQAGYANVTIPPSQKVSLILDIIAQLWTEHLKALEELREGVNLKAHGGQNPVHTYHKEAFELFDAFSDAIQLEVVRKLLAPAEVKSSSKPSKRELAAQAKALVAEELDKRPVSRNEPCPCGSGKKFKLCHGKIR